MDEIAREIGVRERCFPKWIELGKVSNSDAKDRLERLIKAAQIVQIVIDNETHAQAQSELKTETEGVVSGAVTATQ